MKIWVDADACPVAIREILFRAAQKRCCMTTFVANQMIKVPPSPYLQCKQVSSGFDEADQEIIRSVSFGDLVITADIPLADSVISKGAYALSPRGECYTSENIKARLNMRDFMDTLRSSGLNTGGPPPLSLVDRKAFADQFDRILQQAHEE